MSSFRYGAGSTRPGVRALVLLLIAMATINNMPHACNCPLMAAMRQAARCCPQSGSPEIMRQHAPALDALHAGLPAVHCTCGLHAHNADVSVIPGMDDHSSFIPVLLAAQSVITAHDLPPPQAPPIASSGPPVLRHTYLATLRLRI